jgi:hypothetical protein
MAAAIRSVLSRTCSEVPDATARWVRPDNYPAWFEPAPGIGWRLADGSSQLTAWLALAPIVLSL